MKWDVASSDAFYALFHTHDLKGGSRTDQELEPCPGTIIQKNAFFSEVGYMRITGRRKLHWWEIICNPMCMGTDRTLLQHLHQPSNSVKSHILCNFFLFYPNSNNLPKKNTTDTLDHNKQLCIFPLHFWKASYASKQNLVHHWHQRLILPSPSGYLPIVMQFRL